MGCSLWIIVCQANIVYELFIVFAQLRSCPWRLKVNIVSTNVVFCNLLAKECEKTELMKKGGVSKAVNIYVNLEN